MLRETTTPAPATSVTGRRRATRPRALVVLLQLLAACALVLTPVAASAHDRLITSDPADGASVQVSPDAITLTFSDTPLDVSPVVRVTGADGTVVFDGPPTLVDATATATLEQPLAAGTAQVAWRVVSADGHPIEGTFSFTVVEGPAAPATTTTAAASDAGGGASATSTSAASASASAPAEESGGLSPAFLGFIGALILLVVALIALLMVRRRRL